MPRVYISSPYTDLVKHRRAVYRALRQSGLDVIAMEDYVARDERTLGACLRDIRSADIYIGIMAFRYGSVAPESDVRAEFGDEEAEAWLGLSITEIEYRYAKYVLRMPCLTFVAKDGVAWNTQHIDAYALAHEPNAGDACANFRKRLLGDQLSAMFSSPFELASVVQAAISRLSPDRPAISGDKPQERSWSIALDGSPFPGLRPFSRRMTRVYFGRELEVRDVCDLVAAPDSRFVIVSGGSGSGKSSLIEAGVIPDLVSSGIGDCPTVLAAQIRPNHAATAVGSLIEGLRRELGDFDCAGDEFERELMRRPALLRDLVEPLVHPHHAGVGLLILLDQFEQLFAHHSPAVLDSLTLALAELRTIGSVRVLACVRADYLGTWLEDDRIVEVVRQGGHYPLGPVNLMAMAEMIRKPCRAASLAITDGLVSRILEDVGTGPGTLPLLAFIMERLFLERRGLVLREETYNALGGATGAVAEIAERATASLSMIGMDEAAMTDSLHGLFSRLVRVDFDGTPLKRVIARESLPSREQVVADALLKARLLTVDGSGLDARVSLAHEALLRAWPALKGWIEEHHEHLRLVRLAEVQAAEWRKHQYDPACLWHVERLKHLRSALRSLHDSFPAAVAEFAEPQDRLGSRLADGISHEERLSIGLYLGELGDHREGWASHAMAYRTSLGAVLLRCRENRKARRGLRQEVVRRCGLLSTPLPGCSTDFFLRRATVTPTVTGGRA
jgi:hypothetical protein